MYINTVLAMNFFIYSRKNATSDVRKPDVLFESLRLP